MAFNDNGNQLEFAAEALTLAVSHWQKESVSGSSMMPERGSGAV